MKQCSIEGCEHKHRACGYCNKHYVQFVHYNRDHSAVGINHRRQRKLGQVCSVDDCTKPAKTRTYCIVHYGRWSRHGSTDDLTIVNPHRMGQTPEYKAWCNMMHRCYDTKEPGYKRYGGRGISVYDGWRNDFLAFYAYLGNRPSSEYSLDRIDSNGNYEPGNVRWATWHQQQTNKRSNIEHIGVYPQSPYKWYACLRVKGTIYKKYNLTKEQAIEARKALEIEHLGYNVT